MVARLAHAARGALSAGLLAISAPTVFSQETFVRDLVSECEATMKERLVVPQSYVRQDVSAPVVRDATLDEYLGLITDEDRAERERLIAADPVAKESHDLMVQLFSMDRHRIMEVRVTYSARAMGGQVRVQEFLCSTVQVGFDRLSPFDAQTVRVDGLDRIGWSIRGMR